MLEAKAAKRPAAGGRAGLCASASLPKPSSAGQLPPVSLPNTPLAPSYFTYLPTHLPTWTFLIGSYQ